MIKNSYRRIFPSLTVVLRRELSYCNTVLDLGCGKNSIVQNCTTSFSVGVDLFEPDLEESKKNGIHNQYIIADINRVEFKPKSFDAILCFEVLEHLTKEEGFYLLSKMEKWAKKKIIITTPNGYIYQNNFDDNPLQEHKSGWRVGDLKKIGFEVYGMQGWKNLRQYMGTIKYKPLLLWTLISILTQNITYRHPKFAFQLFAIKEINDMGDEFL